MTVRGLIDDLQEKVKNGLPDTTPVVIAITKRDDVLTGLDGVHIERAKSTEREDYAITMWNKFKEKESGEGIEVVTLRWF